MFSIRRAALRFISTPSVSLATRSRTITSFASSTLRTQKAASSFSFQKRWASDDAPISKLQPTPQEEVENAVLEDNAARTVESSTEAPSATETANATRESPEAVGRAAGSAVESGTSINTPPSRSRAPRSEGFGQGQQEDRTPKTTIYVGNLFFDVTEDDLMKEVARFGKVTRVKLIRDARGLSKGFGYVSFSEIPEAENAIKTLNQQLFEGRRLNVGFANTDTPNTVSRNREPRQMNPPTKTLFIGNMSWEMTDRDLNDMFRGIKNVIDVRVAIDRRTGQPRGFAHADFADVKSAMEAMKELQGKETYGRRLRVDYSFGSSSAPKNQARDQGEL